MDLFSGSVCDLPAPCTGNVLEKRQIILNDVFKRFFAWIRDLNPPLYVRITKFRPLFQWPIIIHDSLDDLSLIFKIKTV